MPEYLHSGISVLTLGIYPLLMCHGLVTLVTPVQVVLFVSVYSATDQGNTNNFLSTFRTFVHYWNSHD